eukprot:3548012-Amphidinium_carterae.2
MTLGISTPSKRVGGSALPSECVWLHASRAGICPLGVQGKFTSCLKATPSKYVCRHALWASICPNMMLATSETCSSATTSECVCGHVSWAGLCPLEVQETSKTCERPATCSPSTAPPVSPMRCFGHAKRQRQART